VETNDRSRRIWIILALLAVYICWGTTYLAMRYAVESIPPFLMAGVRFLSAGAILMAVLRLRGAALPTMVQWRNAAITGLLLLVGGNGGVVLAQHWGIASGLAAIGTSIVQIWIALLAVFWGEPPSRLEWAGVGVGLLGVVLLNLESGFHASVAGAVTILLGGICWALGSMLGRRMPLPGGLMSSAAQMLVGGAAFLALSPLIGERVTMMPTNESIASLIYLIFGGALIGYTAYGYLLRTVRPALATSYSYVNPVVAVLLGVTLADEQITLAGILAMTVIIASVVLVIMGRSRRQAPAPTPTQAEVPATGPYRT
jgi:drug/metabolite transporter (DMT)-like permease